MYKLLTTFFCIAAISFSPVKAQILLDSTTVDTITLLQGLTVPWEILWGPDGRIWFTEKTGTISAFNPSSGDRKILRVIQGVATNSEAGLLGMTLHPNF